MKSDLGNPFRKEWLFAMLGLLICILWPGKGLCAVTYRFTFECPSAEGNVQVYSRVIKDNYTVYLPGNWDPEKIKVTFDKPSDAGFGDLTVHSGDIIDLRGKLETKMTLKRNGGYPVGSITFYQGSSVPAVHITVDEKLLRLAVKDKYLIIPEGHVTVTEADGSVAYDGGLIQFKGRGNNTYSNQYAKKPFQIKLSEKANLCGMGKARTWLLIANYLDISLIRNQINMDLAREMGMKGAVEFVQADLWLNGIYNGLYLLSEKIQINQKRLNLRNLEEDTEKLNDVPLDSFKKFREENKKTKTEVRGYEIPREPEDITGGYIIELDKPYRYRNSAVSGFQSSVNLFFVIKEPTSASRAQAYYISGLFEQFLRGLKEENGTDPVSGRYYADLIDMDSFAMKFLVEDFAKNYDALAGSQFFFKDIDSVSTKIFAGPCWDYDLCLGNIDLAGIGSGLNPTKSWAVNIKNGKVNWYAMLYKHPDFREKVVQVYKEKFRPALAVLIGEEGAGGQIIRRMEDYAAAIDASAGMNFVRFRPQNVSGIYSRSGKTHESSLEYLYSWVRERVKAMDQDYLSQAAMDEKDLFTVSETGNQDAP